MQDSDLQGHKIVVMIKSLKSYSFDSGFFGDFLFTNKIGIFSTLI